MLRNKKLKTVGDPRGPIKRPLEGVDPTPNLKKGKNPTNTRRQAYETITLTDALERLKNSTLLDVTVLTDTKGGSQLMFSFTKGGLKWQDVELRYLNELLGEGFGNLPVHIQKTRPKLL